MREVGQKPDDVGGGLDLVRSIFNAVLISEISDQRGVRPSVLSFRGGFADRGGLTSIGVTPSDLHFNLLGI